nr:threonine/serine exporter family protein [Roseburia sp. AM59-24XD]
MDHGASLPFEADGFSSITSISGTHLLLRLITSFGGVFGFSIMFNSPCSIAAAAAFIGAIANTLRLELVDFVAIPPAAAAFIGALTAGILASLLKNKLGYPRISITVPAIVIMVPGLYLYKAVYNLGIMSLTTSASWFASAMLIILALPLGLIFARIITDKSFRYCT